jgi:hypothetical protein
MAELSPVYDGKMVHSGIFDFRELYRFMYEWFRDFSYLILEKKYSEKIKAEGKEIEFEWLCLRKISEDYRFRIKIVTRIVKMVTVEVQEGGVKFNRDKGEIEIKFNSYIERDWQNRWDQHPITKFLRGFYERYMLRGRMDFFEDKVKSEVDETMSQIKSFLSLMGNV